MNTFVDADSADEPIVDEAPLKNSTEIANSTVETAVAKPKTRSYTANGVTFEMVVVDGGTFRMGWDDGRDEEKPAHEERVASFAIGKTEVTQALWKAVMGKNPSYYNNGGNYPVENVRWTDCQDFISKLNALTGKRFRLPTEAEWEYAARGGNRSKGYTYSGSDDIGSVAWYRVNSKDTTRPVAGKEPNELGLYDMSGNVWEWTADKWSKDYSSPRSSSSYVARGGGIDSNTRNQYVVSLCGYDSGHHTDYLGFRLALDY
jgi:formylglycine-generating enzyme required for sulfatase activity